MLRLARDLRDAAGAATLALGLYGAPIALALAQVGAGLEYVEVPEQAQRQATFLPVELPALAPVVADPPAATPAAAPPAAAPPAAAPPAAEPAPAADPEPVAEPEPAAEVAAEPAPLALAVVRDAARPAPPDAETREQILARIRARHAMAYPTARGGSDARRPGEGQQRGRRCEDASGAIVDRGGDSFAVERGLVDLYVNDLELAQKLASVAWHRDEEGKVDGFRIRRIRCGTVLDQAGFENGDVVHSVNGKKIRTVLGAIGAYRKLKRKEHLRVDLTRADGSARTLRFEITEER